MNTLVIEDEEALAGHVVRALTRAGHDAQHAADGPGGLKQALWCWM